MFFQDRYCLELFLDFGVFLLLLCFLKNFIRSVLNRNPYTEILSRVYFRGNNKSGRIFRIAAANNIMYNIYYNIM